MIVLFSSISSLISVNVPFIMILYVNHYTIVSYKESNVTISLLHVGQLIRNKKVCKAC